MSTLLYRLGMAAYRTPWRVIGIWLLVLGAVVGALIANPPQTSTEFRINGTASQEVLDDLARELPAATGASSRIVFVAPDGERVDTPERVAAIREAVAAVDTSPGVVAPTAVSATAPAPEMLAAMAPAGDLLMAPLMDGEAPLTGVTMSSDGSVALLTVQLVDKVVELPAGAADAIVAAASTAESSGLSVLPGSDLTQTMPAPFGPNEVVGLVIAAVVLVLTLGSLVVAGLPLLTALVGVGVGVGAAYALSSVIAMTSVTPVLALMIGLAVGIDYALFIVNRARRLVLDKGLDAHEATGRAVGTAGSAVFFAGMTVLVSLSGLSIVGIPFLTTMALIAAGTVAIAVTVALTLLPALLALIGERVVTPKQRAAHERQVQERGEADSHGRSTWWAELVARHRTAVSVAVVVLLGVVALPVASMQLNLPSDGTANLDTPARQSYDAISAGFGPGFNGPLLVVAHLPQAVVPATLTEVRDTIAGLDHVAAVIPGAFSADGTTVTFTVLPDEGPNATQTRALVETLRDPALGTTAGAVLGVTGVTAINIDMAQVLSDALVPYLAIIVVISLVILALVFRSVFVPLTATLGFVLTIGAALGVVTAVFQWGWFAGLFGIDTPGPVLSFLPIIVTGILYGLAMDYQMFLVSSMRESHVHGYPGVRGVVHGFHSAAPVVVAAGLIMVAVFSGFIFGDDAMIRQIGLALAVGILVDAFLVRMTLIPAVMAWAGERAWWLPAWLDRILPNLDVEGDKLVRTLEARAASARFADGGSTLTERAAQEVSAGR